MNEWLTPKEVSELLNVSRTYVDYLIKGRIRHFANYTVTTPAVFTHVKMVTINVRSHYLIHYSELRKLK